MTKGKQGIALRHLDTLFRVGTVGGLTDAQLLERFTSRRDETSELAFAALVDRHGPMVLRTCRAVLRDGHEAHDAFQATFLILVRRAGSLWVRDSLGPWLHQVALRTASCARAAATRRRRHEGRAAEMKARSARDGDPHGLGGVIHEEVGQLPARYRAAVVLCLLEGLPPEQAARRLNCPVGTVHSRLARGREQLRTRLARRGVSPTVAMIAAALAPEASAAAVTEAWKRNTVKAAVCYAAGKTSASFPMTVAALAQGVLNAMIWDKLKAATTAVILIGIVAGGLGALARSAPPAPEVAKAPYSLRMANGTEIEVVAVSSYPTGPKTWWRPDGSPLDEEPVDASEFGVQAPNIQCRETLTHHCRAILIRVNDLPPGDTLRWYLNHDGRPLVDPRRMIGRRLPGMQMDVSSYQRSRATCQVYVAVSAGPWETDSAHDGKEMSSEPGPPGSGSKDSGFQFGKAREYRGGTVISLARSTMVSLDRDFRCVAVDSEGREHPAVSVGQARGVGNELLEAEFSLPPGRIREYKYQSRPFVRAQINGVSLSPRPGRDVTPESP